MKGPESKLSVPRLSVMGGDDHKGILEGDRTVQYSIVEVKVWLYAFADTLKFLYHKEGIFPYANFLKNELECQENPRWNVDSDSWI